MRVISAAAAALILAGTLFAFGAVYPWASRPAAVASLLVFLFARPTLFRDSTWILDSALVLLVAYGWLQYVPLPGALVATLSPASTAFHQTLDLGLFDPNAWRPLSLAPTASLEAMINLTGAVFVYWTIRESSGHSGTRVLTRSIAVMGALAVVLAVLQPVLFTNGKIYGFWSPIYIEARPVGPMVSRNHFASWMVLAAPITVGYLIMHARTYWVGTTRVRASVKMLTDTRALWVATAAALMVSGVIISQSRAGRIGLGAAVVFSLTMGWRRLGARGRAGLVVASLLFGGAAWAVSNPANVLSRFQERETRDWGGRPEIWAASTRMALQYRLTGVGLGAYEGAMPVYQTPPVTIIFNHAHSQYLQWWSEGGLIGVVISLVVVWAGVRLFRRRQHRDGGPLIHLRQGALAGMLGLAVQSIWETPLVTPAVLWMLAAAAALATERPPAHESHGSSR